MMEALACSPALSMCSRSPPFRLLWRKSVMLASLYGNMARARAMTVVAMPRKFLRMFQNETCMEGGSSGGGG